MKALSIRQPWAWLIMHAGKDIENRVWQTPVRGRILVHAAKGMTRNEWDDAMDFAAGIPSEEHLKAPEVPMFDYIERGGIVGSVEIVDCVHVSNSPWFCGPFGFVLRDPQPLSFRPFKGALGFFEVPDHG